MVLRCGALHAKAERKGQISCKPEVERAVLAEEKSRVRE